jgi:predicted DCC family thiol-disulfide oxidoreductase YuxK
VRLQVRQQGRQAARGARVVRRPGQRGRKVVLAVVLQRRRRRLRRDAAVRRRTVVEVPDLLVNVIKLFKKMLKNFFYYFVTDLLS